MKDSAPFINEDYVAVVTVVPSGTVWTATCSNVTTTSGVCSWDGPGVLTAATDTLTLLASSFKVRGRRWGVGKKGGMLVNVLVRGGGGGNKGGCARVAA